MQKSKFGESFLAAGDKARLTSALDALPTELAYLRPGILWLAEQDQSLLSCGDADTTVFDNCLKERSSNASADIKTDAKNMLNWLKMHIDRDAIWAGPLGFAAGYLDGYDEWAIANDGAPPPPPPAMGLQKTTLEIPNGFKIKDYASGLELKNRQVQMIIGELDDQMWQIRGERFKHPVPPPVNLPPPILPYPAHLRWEVVTNVALGAATGRGLMTIHKETGLTVMAFYLLELPSSKLEISVFARREGGADLSKFEPILASIRCL